MMITNEGVVIRISVEDISVIGRNTSGVKLMNIDQDSDIRGKPLQRYAMMEKSPREMVLRELELLRSIKKEKRRTK